MHRLKLYLGIAAAALAVAFHATVLFLILTARAILRLPEVILAVLLIALVISTPALAQAVAATATSNQLFHIPQAAWDEINALLIGLILALGGLLWKWIDAHSPLKNTQAEAVARDAFMNLLQTGAKYGLTQAGAAEKKVGDVDVGDARVAAAANFVIAQGPGLAAKMGFDVTTPDGRAAIIRSATVRVADLLTPATDAPAKLPLPPAVAMAGTGTPPESSPAEQNATGKAG